MAAITLIVGVTIAFDVARYIASRAAGTIGELDEEVKDFCAGGCCADTNDESLDEDEDEGCMRELCGYEKGEGGPCANCCHDESDDDESGSDSGSDKSSGSDSDEEEEIEEETGQGKDDEQN